MMKNYLSILTTTFLSNLLTFIIIIVTIITTIIIVITAIKKHLTVTIKYSKFNLTPQFLLFPNLISITATTAIAINSIFLITNSVFFIITITITMFKYFL